MNYANKNLSWFTIYFIGIPGCDPVRDVDRRKAGGLLLSIRSILSIILSWFLEISLLKIIASPYTAPLVRIRNLA